MERIFDLPAHPLFVHAPMVLLPLTAIAAVLFTFRPIWRVRFRWQLTAASFIVFVSTFLATQSGEALDHALKGLAPVDKHADLAEVTQILCFGLFVLSVAMAFLGPRLNPISGSDRVSQQYKATGSFLAVIVALVAVLATVWMIRTGHEGASVVWTGTFKK
jgi:K+ transporter